MRTAPARLAAVSLLAALAQPVQAQVLNLPRPGAFEIGATSGPVSLASRGRIEQETATGWETVFDEFQLLEDCSEAGTLPVCTTLAPGAALRPVLWNGYTCNGQCPRACKGNVYRPPGTFRLVLATCDGDAEAAGAPFSMGPKSGR